ncbi:MAG TPA: TonB family protein [Steroidobacteraceae bacterium]|nr:TonB family protein [Steroidobacteraceae bacterium]
MSHVYAARGSRQTAVFTAIAAFHFVVITMGLVPRVLEKVPVALPITPLAPEEKPIPALEKPDVNFEGFTVDISVAEPVFDIPRFDATDAVPEVSTEATPDTGSSSGSPATHAEYVAPRLRTRSGGFAALVSACYPPASRRLIEEGRVVAQVVIDAKGAAVHWSVARSSGFPRLDEATACILRKLEFVAGRRDGQAIAAEAMLPIVFQLD